MVTDILNQPNGGIFEVMCQHLIKCKSIKREEFISHLTYTDSGKKDIQRYLEILIAAELIRNNNDIIQIGDIPLLSQWDGSDPTFTSFFRAELLSKIMSASNPNIRYFQGVIRRLFDEKQVKEDHLEVIVRESKKEAGIEVPSGEHLGGQMDFLKQFLRYFRFTLKIGDVHLVQLPADMLHVVMEYLISKKPNKSLNLYTELFPAIDKEFIPIIKNHSTGDLLPIAEHRVMDPRIKLHFHFCVIPDGGRMLVIGNKQYNQIKGGNE